MIEPRYPCMQSYSTNDVIDAYDSRDSYVFKKFINAAVYVEKTIKKMAPDIQNYDRHVAETIKIMKTKRCSCYIDADSCPCHPTMASGDGLKGTRSETQVNTELAILQNMKKLKSINENIKRTINKRPMQTKISKQPVLHHNPDPTYKLHLSKMNNVILPSETKLENIRNQMNANLPKEYTDKVDEDKENFIMEASSKIETICKSEVQEQVSGNESSSTITSLSTLSTCSQITVKRSDKAFMCETKISLTSLTSFTPTESDTVRQWLSRKLEEQKKKQLALRQEERKKQMEREKILEKERENFTMWLAAKKKEEEKKKAEIEKQLQISQLRELEKQKRDLENQIKYQIWLKRKEEADIEKKNQEQLKYLQAEMQKNLREEANRKAYEEWLEYSKHKPKPLPLNRGLDSLRSSLSVTYINPVPWVPNIQKPASQ